MSPTNGGCVHVDGCTYSTVKKIRGSSFRIGASWKAKVDDLERQLVEERAQIDCATNNGWLSDDLECAGEDGPACWKHLLAGIQKKLKEIREAAENHAAQASRDYEYDGGMNRAGETILAILGEDE